MWETGSTSSSSNLYMYQLQYNLQEVIRFRLGRWCLPRSATASSWTDPKSQISFFFQRTITWWHATGSLLLDPHPNLHAIYASSFFPHETGHISSVLGIINAPPAPTLVTVHWKSHPTACICHALAGHPTSASLHADWTDYLFRN